MTAKHFIFRVFILMLTASIVYLLLSRDSSEEPIRYDKLFDGMIDAGLYPATGKVDTDLLAHRTLVISGDINAATADHAIKSLLLLNALDQETPINIYIRSNGGWVSDAFAIIDVIQSISAPVNTHAIGATESSGALILAAGTGTRFGYPNSLIMFHAGHYLDDDGQYSLDVLENKRIYSFLEKHTHVPEKWLNYEEDKKLYLPAHKAAKWGLIDRINTNTTFRVKS